MHKPLKLLLLTFLSVCTAGTASAYRIYFNKIICVNPMYIPMKDNEEVRLKKGIMTSFKNDANRGTKTADVMYDDMTLYWDNKKSADVSYISDAYLSKYTGKIGGTSKLSNNNDMLYVTYKDKAREGMVLPVRGGNKEMFSNCHWLPQPADGNPAMAGGPSIRYYLWESNPVISDKLLNYFTIDLPGMVNKGPQLVMLTTTHGGNEEPANAIYVIEYEVKP